MNETWRRIRGFCYEVSNLGNVKRKAGDNYDSGRNSKPWVDYQGYKKVGLYGNKYRIFRVHRLVAEAFIRPLKPNEVVHHRDGDPRNNKLENLEILPSIGLNSAQDLAGRKQLWNTHSRHRRRSSELALVSTISNQDD